MFDILDPLARAIIALESDAHRPIGEAYCKAEQKHTLQQVGVRLDYLLKHCPSKSISFRREIGLLAEELEKEVED